MEAQSVISGTEPIENLHGHIPDSVWKKIQRGNLVSITIKSVNHPYWQFIGSTQVLGIDSESICFIDDSESVKYPSVRIVGRYDPYSRPVKISII